MQIVKNTFALLFALFLMITITITAIPLTVAHDPPWRVPTSAYVSCAPNRIGIGQSTTIVVWVDRYSPTAGGGIGQRWNGFKIDITKPDGKNETIGPFQCSSDVGSDFKVYTPDQVGTYTIVFSWPGETVKPSPAVLTSDAIGDFYEGSTSKPAYLYVQQEPIAPWQEPPLPTDYWTTPINAANRGWSTLASNWLGGSWLVAGFQRWGIAPESAHILWTQPLTAGRGGGILDAQWPGISMNAEDYESPWGSPIIMNGKIYYNSPAVSDSAKYGYYCMDLYTGQTIWYKNGTDNGLNNPYTVASGYALSQSYPGLTQGQIYHYHSVNGDGLLSYLIMVQGSTWYFLDAATGNWILTLINVPSGVTVMDQDGSILIYTYNKATGNILCWNSSQAIPPLGPVGTNQQQWKMRFGATIDAVNDTSWIKVGPSGDVTAQELVHSAYSMNVTIQAGLPFSGGFGAAPSGISAVLQDENRVPKQLFGFYKGSGSSIGSPIDPDTFSAWIVDINEHATGYNTYPNLTNTQNSNLGYTASLKWNKTITVPLPGKNYTWNLGGVSYDNQVFMLRCSQTGQLWAYSLTDGSLLWGPTPQFSQMDFYGISSNMYYDKLLECSSYGGTIAAFKAKTGELLWTYNATAPGFEGYYGENMPLSIWAVCDGKVYTYSTEHSPSKPLWRASYIRCINITDGTEIWKLLNFKSFIGTPGLANGYIVHCSDYDNLIYCIGKGPSATTVSAPQIGMPMGSTYVITGTVNDISPGALASGPKFGYTNGIPAVSDESQEGWMEYIYEQQAKPSNATGVPVSIDAIDPNNNFIHIGDAVTDTSGTFGYSWTTPDVPGQYRIIASFKGSKSYGSSSAATFAYVGEAAPTPSPYMGTAQPPTEMYFAISTIAIIIAIAIATVLLLMTLKKRP
ncbi:MAG: PQQ-binding-like beta-propeller repeat protein [Candidatus Bathyarchaeota archaeon]|nr:PQQ-binding-like beta-propeller repeat protein [Candidatus Bathyarchaeota archaeon]